MILSPMPEHEGDLERLLGEMSASRYIGHISRGEMDSFVAGGTARFFYDEKKGLVGFGAWVEINADWVEIGPIYALEEARGQGVGRYVLASLVELTRPRHQYAVTKNEIVMRMFEQMGLHEVGFWELSAGVRWYVVRKLSVVRVIKMVGKFRFERVTHWVSV